MRRLNRRGGWELEEFGSLLYRVIAIALVIAVIVLLAKNLWASNRPGYEACRLSLAAKVKADEKLMGRPSSVFGDLCRTIEETLPKSGKDREALKADFANLIAKAWYETLEGEHLNVFDEPEGKIGPFTVEKVGCFPAFLVNVEHTQAFPRGDKIEPGELEEYLRLETYHDLGSLGSGLDYTYLDYVQFAKGPGFVAIKNPIEPDTNYIIAVISPSKFVGFVPAPLKAFIEGYWTGNEEAANWVLVVREDELEEECRPI